LGFFSAATVAGSPASPASWFCGASVSLDEKPALELQVVWKTVRYHRSSYLGINKQQKQYDRIILLTKVAPIKKSAFIVQHQQRVTQLAEVDNDGNEITISRIPWHGLNNVE
jgi:hypothetical protein